MTRGGTRWRRFGLLFIPALLGVGALAAMSLFGILPLNLSVSGQDFKLTSKGAQVTAPEGLQAYMSTQQMKNDGAHEPIIYATLPRAELPDGLCLSLVLTFPVVGTKTIQIDFVGRTVVNDLTASADEALAGATAIGAQTTDGASPRTDQSNVEKPVQVGVDSAELGGPAGGFGASIPGAMTAEKLQASARAARISGTLKIGGMGMPKLASGRGVENGECY